MRLLLLIWIFLGFLGTAQSAKHNRSAKHNPLHCNEKIDLKILDKKYAQQLAKMLNERCLVPKTKSLQGTAFVLDFDNTMFDTITWHNTVEELKKKILEDKESLESTPQIIESEFTEKTITAIKENIEPNQYDALDTALAELVTKASQLDLKIYVISNATTLWINTIIGAFLPKLATILTNHHYPIISARETYEQEHPECDPKSSEEWKIDVFKNKLESYKRVISVGDSEPEWIALEKLSNDHIKVNIAFYSSGDLIIISKNAKIPPHDNILQQIATLNSHLEQLSQTEENLKKVTTFSSNRWSLDDEKSNSSYSKKENYSFHQ